jgi:bla regulator protein blaR1
MATRVSRREYMSSKILLAWGGGIVLLTAPLAGFAQMAVSQGARVDAKPMAFEVVLIRQHKENDVTPSDGPTANGYRVTNMSLAVAIVTAYFPQTGNSALYMKNQVKGIPDWMRDQYDIEAKVSETDLAEWHKPAAQNAMLQAMLQAMLADRLKLAVHRDIKEVPVYSLVVGKSGPKFKEANAAEAHQGVTLPNGGGTIVPEDGGHTVHFYAVSMTSLVSVLSTWAGRPVQDKTGLTGKYDLQMPNPAMPAASADGSAAAPDPQSSVVTSMEDLGLKLVPGKGQVETLVIDHVERPSEN